MSIAITLPDGSVRHYEQPVSGLQLAADIGPGLAKASLAMIVNGNQMDLTTTLTTSCTVQFITTKSP
jgi:threonyl-tRNA synthetase